ncbi:MAG TPA: cobalamin-independent methionine synthase II family protein [Solirubrobacteraceae bacterium]|jgi:5-methyltetrahydropteroyltriglutamate--homocysteine methyltransferase|nr:cobalamin-independent methionine synthase II family protein [Solirubrobacteraceae bacterium]
MRHSSERILTTHTGSLPRPKGLTELVFEKQESKPVDAAVFEAAAAQATDDVVARQIAAGIDVVSDGEMNKPGFVNYVGERLEGFGEPGKPWMLSDLEALPELTMALYGGPGGTHINMPACRGEVSYKGHAMVAKDIEHLRTALAKAGDPDREAFIPAASPGCIANCAENFHYPSYEAYLEAVTAAMSEEYKAIVDAGFLLQLDCPDLPMAAHTSFWALSHMEEMGFERYIQMHLDALDQSIADLPADRVRLHLCWGNYAGPHTADIPIERLFNMVMGAKPAAVSFEAANPRHEHEWETLASLPIPDDKILMPGLIDTKTNVVEHPHLIAQRIGRFADIVGRERVIPGTDCGFATFAGFGIVDPEVAWMKLASLAQGAAEASERLWSSAVTA